MPGYSDAPWPLSPRANASLARFCRARCGNVPQVAQGCARPQEPRVQWDRKVVVASRVGRVEAQHGHARRSRRPWAEIDALRRASVDPGDLDRQQDGNRDAWREGNRRDVIEQPFNARRRTTRWRSAGGATRAFGRSTASSAARSRGWPSRRERWVDLRRLASLTEEDLEGAGAMVMARPETTRDCVGGPPPSGGVERRRASVEVLRRRGRCR